MRLLLREAQGVQQPTDVVRMVRYSELAANNLCHSLARPPIGREAGFKRTGPHELRHAALLGRRQLRWATGNRLRPQRRVSARLPSPFPTLDARHVGRDELRHFRETLPIRQESRGPTTTQFQLRRTACWSHTYRYAC